MLLFANKARSLLTGSVTSAAGQVAAVTAASGALFVGVGGVATSTTNPMRCVMTAVDGSGNDTGAFEVVEITRSGDNLTLVSRGLEGTTAAAWGAGTVIECRPSAGTRNRLPQPLLVGVGQVGQTSTSAVSLMPGGAAYSIPGGTLAVGDQVIMRFIGARRGGQNTQSVNYEVFWNAVSMFGGTLSSTSFSPTWSVDWHVAIVGSSSQSAVAWIYAGGGSNPSESFFSASIASAITIDFKGQWSATATDTFGLEGISIHLHRAAT